jgi:DNA modification methylase
MVNQKEHVTNSTVSNIIGFGDSEQLLQELPEESVDLIFTSPPYFNARPEYSRYSDYDSYLSKMEAIIQCCHRVLSEGRFFVLNSSPILIPRSRRNKSSQRKAIPFDLHHVVMGAGFDFIDDIIWVKQTASCCHRGRNFERIRKPLLYKTIPVTEYVMVYRKQTDKLLDWNIRYTHESCSRSLIPDGYEKTNVWHISPVRSRNHPAIFPLGLADRVIRYYSFYGDTVLDFFAGSGTVGVAASLLGRRFILFDQQEEYVRLMCQRHEFNTVPIEYRHCNNLRCRQPQLIERTDD